MPELPEVETTLRGITPYLVGRKVTQVKVRNANLRWPVSPELAECIQGETLLDIQRRGKYLLMRFKQGTAIWHLGMSGSLRIIRDNQAPGKHDHIDWQFTHQCILRFNDPRRFGSLIWTETDPYSHSLLSHLGPEPLSNEFTSDFLFRHTRASRQPIKSWLMNAKNLVGVGNIYANEALFASGIHPLKKTHLISQKKCALLVDAIKNILTAAIQRGGTTLKDFVGGDGKPGYFAQELKVYGRGGQPCVVCKKKLTEKTLGQRTTVYCIGCQK